MNRNIILLFALLSSIFWGCKRNGSGLGDTPVSGNITIWADENYKPLIESEVMVFEGIYSNAKIKVMCAAEPSCFNALVNDSTHLIISSRPLNKNEEDFLKSKKIFPRQTVIAVDGIALLVNPANKDTILSMDVLKKIFTGKIKTWKEINPKSNLGIIKVIFDNPFSGTVRYIKDSVCNGQPLDTSLSAVNYNKDVVDFVARNENSLGIIGVNWVSNPNDTSALSFLNQVKVLYVSKYEDADESNSYQPFQYYLKNRQYPLMRNVYVINVEPRNGLASGFASFLASDRGQRIILKSGILPATQPIRIVNVKDESPF